MNRFRHLIRAYLVHVPLFPNLFHLCCLGGWREHGLENGLYCHRSHDGNLESDHGFCCVYLSSWGCILHWNLFHIFRLRHLILILCELINYDLLISTFLNRRSCHHPARRSDAICWYCSFFLRSAKIHQPNDWRIPPTSTTFWNDLNTFSRTL